MIKSMIWSEEAENALAGIPFFMRGKVRKEIEKEAAGQGSRRVFPAHVRECRQKFLPESLLSPKDFR